MARAAKSKIQRPIDNELNRICIEMAIRWPVISVGGGYGGSVGGHPRLDQDVDLIGRARKIRAWIKGEIQ